MAKGTLTITFDSIEDLYVQLRGMLGYMQGSVILSGAVAEGSILQEKIRTMGAVIIKEPEAAAPSPEPKTASGIEAEVRKANADAAVKALALEKATVVEVVAPVVEKPAELNAAPTPAPVEQVQTAAPATQSGPVVETVTLETVETVPYEELLAFCERNPVTGMDVTKCKPSFFRKLVEMRVKAYLETK